MRVIKFRGKVIEGCEKGEWICGDLLEMDDDDVYIQVDYLINADYIIDPVGGEYVKRKLKVDSETVGQLLGIRDEIGAPVFEGDIMKVLIDGQEELGVVEYVDSLCSFRWRRPKDSEFYELNILATFRPFRVVGNIYDNPVKKGDDNSGKEKKAKTRRKKKREGRGKSTRSAPKRER